MGRLAKLMIKAAHIADTQGKLKGEKPVSLLLPWTKCYCLWVFLIKTTVKKVEFPKVCITEAARVLLLLL